ncbi:50S ribosomal protein L22 [Thermoplasmatales archaeon SW_10_69_26]|nr:MAG: 50S ribosomal protein L22 [Thermoplasmatales archaeon SW_10_69_26]
MGIGYSVDPDPDVTSKALGKELQIKPRDAIEVCREVRGRSLDDAKEFLQAVIEKDEAVPYRKDSGPGSYSHQQDTGPGRYPVKVSENILDIIEQAEANAEYKGLEPDDLFVMHAAAQKAGEIEGTRPRARGRATSWNTSLTHVEIVLEEEREEGS